MSTMNVQQVLNQMKILSQNNVIPESNQTNRPEFSQLLSESLNQVNELQREASEMKTSFEMGDTNVDIPEVMIAVQKASLSFEAITEVRNKLLTAYQDVMNMQV
ncbi:MAG: flagellar hook-basal body complex protein FliE [SAR86 cluster bacterium]|uniref:Flagellar hook-basal body complex protein FliE n=1 Tax=SAR86 cluster bacterium TaxID=2030880 RepID=A0A2A5B523_9GAMM|nr:MAG: flagellar hook-basal body complex protein FliE [SAR86 cluster bacterium]